MNYFSQGPVARRRGAEGSTTRLSTRAQRCRSFGSSGAPTAQRSGTESPETHFVCTCMPAHLGGNVRLGARVTPRRTLRPGHGSKWPANRQRGRCTTSRHSMFTLYIKERRTRSYLLDLKVFVIFRRFCPLVPVYDPCSALHKRMRTRTLVSSPHRLFLLQRVTHF